MNFTELEEKIGYKFKDIVLIETAMTHSSYANEKQLSRECNERLEFLGDSVLGVITAEYFYHNLNHLPEGEMTKKRAACACEKSLFGFAKEINLGDFILLGKGEERTGGRKRASILADAFEALLAAIYLDAGKEETARFLLPYVKKEAAILKNGRSKDYKTMLQQIIQQKPGEILEYVLVGESGPDHKKTFETEARLNSNVIGHGKGSSKRESEQMAAYQALILFGVETPDNEKETTL